jgi:hypothetical protein
VKNEPHHVEHQRRNMILYHIIYDFSNDIIYGCGLATAVTHDHLIAFVLWLVIFSEGFRRHSRKEKFSYETRMTKIRSLLI